MQPNILTLPLILTTIAAPVLHHRAVPRRWRYSCSLAKPSAGCLRPIWNSVKNLKERLQRLMIQQLEARGLRRQQLPTLVFFSEDGAVYPVPRACSHIPMRLTLGIPFPALRYPAALRCAMTLVTAADRLQ